MFNRKHLSDNKKYLVTINEVSKVTYAQEKDVEKLLLTKSHNLIFYLSIIFSTLSIITTLLFNKDFSDFIFDNNIILVSVSSLYILILIFIVLTLELSLKIQYVKPNKKFPYGKFFYDKYVSRNNNYNEKIMKYYDGVIKNLDLRNKENVEYLRLAYYVYSKIFLNIVLFVPFIMQHIIFKNKNKDIFFAGVYFIILSIQVYYIIKKYILLNTNIKSMKEKNNKGD